MLTITQIGVNQLRLRIPYRLLEKVDAIIRAYSQSNSARITRHPGGWLMSTFRDGGKDTYFTTEVSFSRRGPDGCVPIPADACAEQIFKLEPSAVYDKRRRAQ